MGANLSSLFGACEEDDNDSSSEAYLELTDLGGFLSKYIFIMLDKDKQNMVSKQEYLKLVNHFREEKTTEEELDLFLNRHLPEGQSADYINESLFRKLIVQLAMDFDQNVSDRMKYLMTLFDKDNDGFVSEQDLRNVYGAIGIQVPVEPIINLIHKFDVDKDNKLNAEEFEQLGRSSLTKLFAKKVIKSTEDRLVAEALIKGSASLLAKMNITAEKVNSSSSTHASPRQSASTSDTNSNLDQINQEESDSVIDSTSYVFGDELGSKVKKPVILVGGRISSESVFGNESVFGDDPTISNTTTTAPEKDGAYASGGRGDSLSSVFAEE